MPGRTHSQSGPKTANASGHSLSQSLRIAGEAVLLALICLSPWAFGSVEAPYEAIVASGIMLLTALWLTDSALTGRFTLRWDVVTICLLGLVLLSLIQLIPLPESIVGIISPNRREWHTTLLPERLEQLPGQSESPLRSTWIPLTVDAAATRTFLLRVFGVWLVYAAARNWLADRQTYPRLSWALVGNGVVLALFAVSQFFSSRRGVVFWDIPVEGSPFGPFICRNHYPDYLALCIGVGVGLLLPRTPTDSYRAPWLLTPRGLSLAAAIGLMLASVLFSLSRAGIISTAAAAILTGLLARRRGGVGLLVIGAVITIGFALAYWLGLDPVEDRLSTLGSHEAAEDRWPLWRDSLRLVPGCWFAGSGGGSFPFVEPTMRTWGSPQAIAENAHNEYIEALVEGGIVRLALTLGLVVGLFTRLVRCYHERQDRSVGPWLVGAVFGLGVVAIHAVGDFGIHMPAIAITVAAVAGYALAAAQDHDFLPSRKEQPKSENTQAPATAQSVLRRKHRRIKPVHILMAVLAGGGSLLLALDAYSRARVDRLRVTVLQIPYDLHERSALLDERAALSPHNADVLTDAAQGHIEIAIQQTWSIGASVAGVGAGFVAYPDRIPASIVDQHLAIALRYLLTARQSNPLAPRPHARLAVYASYFAKSEPEKVHFTRAKKLLPSDPELWFASGREAFARNDRATAWNDWRASLALSQRHLREILTSAKKSLTPNEIREQLLPKDALVVLAAADVLYPDRITQAAERRPFVEAAITLVSDSAKPDQQVALATAFNELGRFEEAGAILKRVQTAAPHRQDVREAYVRWLEQEERYEEAIPHLEWLLQKNPYSAGHRDRLDAALHGLKLQKEIENP